MIKKSFLSLFLISIFFFSLLFTESGLSQDKKNTITVEPAYISSYAQLRFIYHRDLIINDTGKNGEFLLSTSVGYGIGNNDGNDIVRDQKIITLGINPAFRFSKIHRIEFGLQYYYDRFAEGYGVITDEDWEYKHKLKFRFGYRIESRTLVLKMFVEPEFIERKTRYGYNSSVSEFTIGAGIGFGFRF